MSEAAQARAVRPFSPDNFCFGREQVAQLREQTLRVSGEWVRHEPSGANPQFVVMHFQDIPSSQEGNGFVSPSPVLRLFGFADHFKVRPKIARNSGIGSCFTVAGLSYDVRNVMCDMHGLLTIDLRRKDKCEAPDPEFMADVAALTPCSNAQSCADT